MTSQCGSGAVPDVAAQRADERLARLGTPKATARLDAACAASSQAGPVEVSTQSTTPVIASSVHSRLRWLKSRCRKVGAYAGSGPGEQLEGVLPRLRVLGPGPAPPTWPPTPRTGRSGTGVPAGRRGSSASRSRHRARGAVRRCRRAGSPGSRDIRCAGHPCRRSRRRRGRGSSGPGRPCRPVRAGRCARERSARRRGCATARSVINRSTDSAPDASRSASIAEVMPPGERLVGDHGAPSTSPAQASAPSMSTMRRR